MSNNKRRSSDGIAFEKDVLRILDILGYRMKRNVLIKGCQIDIYGEYYTGLIPLRLMVECKEYESNRTVGINEVTKFAGTVAVARNNGIVDKGLIVTTNGFTAGAKEHAAAAGIELMIFSELSTQLVNFDAYIDQLIAEFEDSPVSKYYIDISGTETEDYEIGQNVVFFRPIDDYVNMCMFHDGRAKLALLGNFGTGKSTFCQKYTYTLAKSYKSNKGLRVPILISLRDYDARFDIQTLILNTLSIKYGIAITPAVCQALQRIGKFMLIFDGFDEMDAKANPDTIRENLRELNKVLEIKGNKFIITCRTHFFRNKIQSEVLADFDIVYIPEWGEIELQEYLQKRFGGGWQHFLTRIIGTHNLPELARTPLFLEMISETLANLGENVKRIELYRAYTNNWIRNQSKRKGALLRADARRNLIKELAIKLYNENRRTCHYREFKDLVIQYLSNDQSEENLHFEIENAVQIDYLQNDVQTCTFLIRDSIGNYSFRHTSFLDFFAAWVIAEELRKGICRYLEGAILPIEIRGFLLDFLGEDVPVEQLLGLYNKAEEGILRDNLLSLTSHLRIAIPQIEKSEFNNNSATQQAIRFVQGDAAAFDELFRKYYSQLQFYLRRNFDLTQPEIEDLITEAFFNLWEKRERLESLKNIEGFLYTVVRNKTIDLLRKKSREKSNLEAISADFIPNEEGLPEDLEREFSIRLSTLKEAINKLRPKERNFVEILYLGNRSIGETCKLLGIKISEGYALKKRALDKLKKHMLVNLK